jgi:hypothetical protein
LVLDFSSFFYLIDFVVEDFVSFKALALGDFFISTSFSAFFYLVGSITFPKNNIFPVSFC